MWLLDITNSYKTRWLIELPRAKLSDKKSKHCVRSVRAQGCCPMNITFTSEAASLFVLKKNVENYKFPSQIAGKCFSESLIYCKKISREGCASTPPEALAFGP